VSPWQNKDVFIIAEIGGNHEGDFEYAKKLTRLACESAADSIKYQIYTGDTLVSPVESPQRNQHFKKFQLKPEQYLELAQMCKEYGKDFAASVWDVDAIDWIENQLTYYKVGSGDLTAYPILKKITAKKKPIVLSTGLATLSEVLDAVQFIRKQDSMYESAENLGVLQCTSMYPIPFSDANLNAMNVFREKMPSVTVGYSDHTEGTMAVEMAVAMGAKILEVHFTDSREGKQFRDHKVSLTKDEINRLRETIHAIRSLQGSGEKKPMPSEIENGHVVSFRRALYLNRDYSAGETLKESDFVYLRPNHGVDARDWLKVIGKKTKRPIKAFAKFELSDLE
jgi:N,N'-diacetyllegionaminate synthase